MAKVFQIYSGEDRQRLECAENSREYYRRESRRGSGGAWDFSDGRSKIGTWKPLDLYVPNSLDAPSDIYNFNNRSLILEERAKNVLLPVIASCGEMYEQAFEDRMLYVFNILKFTSDPLGNDDSPEDGLFYDLAGVDTSLARLSWVIPVAISGVTSPELDFKLLVEKHNLKGLSFREVWDSENYVPYVAPAEDEDE